MPEKTFYNSQNAIHRLQWAYRRSTECGLTAIQCSVYRHIAFRDSGDGCWQSHRSLCRELCIGRRNTIIDAIQCLERLGLVRVKRTTGAVATIYMEHPAPATAAKPQSRPADHPNEDTINATLDGVAATYTPRERRDGDFDGFRDYILGPTFQSQENALAIHKAWQTWRTRPAHRAD